MSDTTSTRFTVWQCVDDCCESKAHADKWWNASIAPGVYFSVPTWRDAQILVQAKQYEFVRSWIGAGS